MTGNKQLKKFSQTTGIFLDYINRFSGRDDDTDYFLNLKKEHTFNVLKHSQEIANSFNLSSLEYVLTPYAALLHDVGRFPQYYNYKTFHDASSEDHGLIGSQVIKENNLLKYVNNEYHDHIYFAVFNHNKLSFPYKDDLSNNLLLVVRDSDKLDIFRVLCNHLDPSKGKSLNSHLPDNGIVNQELVNDLLERKQICYSKRKSYDDMKITMLNWIHDFNFKYSFKHVQEMDYINIIIDSIKGEFDKKAVRNHLHSVIAANQKE